MEFTNVAGVPGAVEIEVDKSERRSFRRGVDLSSYGPDAPVHVRVGSFVEAEGLTGDEPKQRPFLMLCPDRGPAISMSRMQWNITKRLADAAWDWFEREFSPPAIVESAPAGSASKLPDHNRALRDAQEALVIPSMRTSAADQTNLARAYLDLLAVNARISREKTDADNSK